MGYRTFGRLNERRSNAILFPSWFGGNSEDLEEFVGPGKMLDPEQYFIVLIDALGDGVSSSPSNSPTQPKSQFPRITMRDMVNSGYLLATRELGLKHVHAVLGISMGGMQTFQWIVSYPDFMDAAIPIVGSTQLTSYDRLLWTTQARTIELHLQHGDETGAMSEAALIEALILTTPANVAATVKREDFDKFIAQTIADERTNPYDHLSQLNAILSLDVSPAGGTPEDAAKLVKAKLLVIPSRQDHLVNPLPAMRFAEALRAPMLVLENDCGHLETSCQRAVLTAAVRGFLSEN